MPIEQHTIATTRSQPAYRGPATIVLALLTTMLMLAATMSSAWAEKVAVSSAADVGGSCADLLVGGDGEMLSEVRSTLGIDGTYDGSGIGIAVIDTGVNPVAGLDAPGKIVDGPDLSFDGPYDNLRHRDLYGHGTSMASIMAGGDSSFGSGIAPGATIVNVKAGSASGAVDVSQAIAAIDWVVQNRNYAGVDIRIISLAFATDAESDYMVDPLAHAVENAWRAGIVVVAAGGNDGRSVHRLGNPAINPFIIAVGAAIQENNGNWKVPNWSSTGDGVRNPDFVAPGARIAAAGTPGSFLATEYQDAACYTAGGDLVLRGSGSSQAAAVASGSVAVLLEERPWLSPDQVKHLLSSTASDLNAHPRQQGAGLINVAAAAATPDPGAEAIQHHAPSAGTGSIEDARGTMHVGSDADMITGEMTAFGTDWVPTEWAAASDAASAWSEQAFDESTGLWLSGTWSSATWSSGTWSSATWSSATWSSATWSSATWSSATWSSATWSSGTWSSGTWSSGTWSSGTWSSGTWSSGFWI